MQDILRGRVTRPEYVALLGDLHAVYHALERRIATHAASPLLAPFQFAPLARAAAIRADLEVLAATASPMLVVPLASTAAQEYVHAVESADPPGLVAHAYVRYLGDLSGGQVLHKIVARALALPGESGLSFYAFPGVGDASAFKDRYRVALDALPLTDDECDRVVAEAVRAFGLNISLFEASGTRTPSSAAPHPPRNG